MEGEKQGKIQGSKSINLISFMERLIIWIKATDVTLLSGVNLFARIIYICYLLTI